MKKVLLPLLLASGLLSAQKFEISVSYGASTVYDATYELASAITINSITKESNPSSMGVAAIGVAMYSENMKWRYGVDVVNEFFGKTASVSKQNILSVLPKVDYFWLRKEKLGLYSGAAAGVTFVNTTYVDKNKKERKDTDSVFGFNVVPIGVRYGGNLSVFLETNVGMKGIAQGGVAYRF